MIRIAASDLPLLAAIAEGEDVGDADFRGRADATLHLSGDAYAVVVSRLGAGGLVAIGLDGEVTGVTPAGRARLRPRIR